MKVLMMTSPEPLENKTGFSMHEKRFPLGIGFVIAVLKHAGHEVTFIDQYLKRDFSFNPDDYDVIGVSTNTPCWEGTKDLLEYIQSRRNEKTRIMIGGPHASVHLETIPDYVDHIVQGEAEFVVDDIVCENIRERVIKTGRITDLDKVPLPDYESYQDGAYLTTVPWFEGKTYNMNTSRGCPYSCQFCAVKSIWGRKYVYMSAERVVDDIKYLVKTYGIKGVYFREDNFTLIRQRIVDISTGIIPLKIHWACETRVDTISYEELKIMHASGCRALYIGFESGSQRILNLLNKGITPEQGLKVAEWCHELGIAIAGSFITDHPEETVYDKKLTDDFIKVLGLANCWKNKYREGG